MTSRVEYEEEPSKEAGKVDQERTSDSYGYWCPRSPEKKKLVEQSKFYKV